MRQHREARAGGVLPCDGTRLTQGHVAEAQVHAHASTVTRGGPHNRGPGHAPHAGSACQPDAPGNKESPPNPAKTRKTKGIREKKMNSLKSTEHEEFALKARSAGSHEEFALNARSAGCPGLSSAACCLLPGADISGSSRLSCSTRPVSLPLRATRSSVARSASMSRALNEGQGRPAATDAGNMG